MTTDIVLYVSTDATRTLTRRLRNVVGCDPLPSELHGLVYATRVLSVGALRERLSNEVNWGKAVGMLVYREHEERSRAVECPEYPARRHGRTVEHGANLAPGRWYLHPDGVRRRYEYREGGFEGWEWNEGTTRMRAPVAECPGPWTEIDMMPAPI